MTVSGSKRRASWIPKRAALIIRMNDLLIEDIVLIPVIWRNGVRAMSHKLQGVELSDWDSDFWDLPIGTGRRRAWEKMCINTCCAVFSSPFRR